MLVHNYYESIRTYGLSSPAYLLGALGRTLSELGDLEGADAAFRRAGELGSLDAGSRVVHVLQKAEERDLGEADRRLEESFREAVERGEPGAAERLASFRELRGD